MLNFSDDGVVLCNRDEATAVLKRQVLLSSADSYAASSHEVDLLFITGE